jgi:hypothetical protein
MIGESETKTDIIDRILDIELGMILGLPSSWKNFYQEHPERFKFSRSAQFIPWSLETLESYLHDLENALREGVNLIAVRMDNVHNPRDTNALVNVIVAHQCLWQREVIRKYPAMMNGKRMTGTSGESPFLASFEAYLKSELESYSDRTLRLLHRDILDKHAQGINMAEETYRYLIQELGFDSLSEAEEHAEGKGKKAAGAAGARRLRVVEQT